MMKAQQDNLAKSMQNQTVSIVLVFCIWKNCNFGNLDFLSHLVFAVILFDVILIIGIDLLSIIMNEWCEINKYENQLFVSFFTVILNFLQK